LAAPLFVTAALRGHRPANYRNFVRLTIWLVTSGCFWVFGASTVTATPLR
jgi:low temperature requirement protein LtrA